MKDDPLRIAAERLEKLLAGPPSNPLSVDLEINVKPISPESSVYRFEIRNVATEPLRLISISLYPALAATDFGLDDTHMKLPSDPPVLIAQLAPGEQVAVLRERCGPPSRYEGPATKQVVARYAVGATEAVSGHSIAVKIEC